MTRPSWHRAAAAYLAAQSLGATAWWVLLLSVPATRAYFRATAPDEVLLAFLPGDAILFIGAALWSAAWLYVQPAKALVPLALHTGSGVYAALYCLALWRATGEGGLAALAMAPCLLAQPVILTKLATESHQ